MERQLTLKSFCSVRDPNPFKCIRVIPPSVGADVTLFPLFFEEDRERIFKALYSSVSFKDEEIVMFGKPILAPRRTCSFGDDNVKYPYARKIDIPLPWSKAPPELLEVKQRIEEYTGKKFNYVLLNLYEKTDNPKRQPHLGYHADNEPVIVPRSMIASASFGGMRDMLFARDFDTPCGLSDRSVESTYYSYDVKNDGTRMVYQVPLPPGSLLIMEGDTQKNWKHAIPKRPEQNETRINLTFRMLIPDFVV